MTTMETDKNEHNLSDAEEQKARWVEHFKEILNGPPPSETFDYKQLEKMDSMSIVMDIKDLEKVKNAIERLEKHKGCR